MSAEHGLFNITNTIDAVMWLWVVHNTVNDRLAGGPTEDPKHPKGHFPTRAQCRTCFDLKANHMVLSFLSSFYGRDAIKLDGLMNSEVTGVMAAGVDNKPVAGVMVFMIAAVLSHFVQC